MLPLRDELMKLKLIHAKTVMISHSKIKPWQL